MSRRPDARGAQRGDDQPAGASRARTHVCAVDALEVGRVREVDLGRDALGRPRSALVLRPAVDAPVVAYLNRCQHLPIPLGPSSDSLLAPGGQHLVCATHGATYRVDDGHCIFGPCEGAHLAPLEVTVEAGEVYLAVPAGE
ncbi:MAG: Rieske 2Fe-2S domain-containing protein [Myxococcales bacterium]|nr:Rieske 2Fe-2S domain-containing protein [Myxococcales bacterium]